MNFITTENKKILLFILYTIAFGFYLWGNKGDITIVKVLLVSAIYGIISYGLVFSKATAEIKRLPHFSSQNVISPVVVRFMRYIIVAGLMAFFNYLFREDMAACGIYVVIVPIALLLIQILALDFVVAMSGDRSQSPWNTESILVSVFVIGCILWMINATLRPIHRMTSLWTCVERNIR